MPDHDPNRLGAPPHGGDFARYVDELVNRGRPVPGRDESPDAADAANALRYWRYRPRGVGDPDQGAPAPPSADNDWGRAPRAPATAGRQPAGSVASTVRNALRQAALSQPATASQNVAAALPGALAVARQRLGRLAGSLLLVLGAVWIALALAFDIPMFADNLGIAMVMLFAAFWLLPSRKPRPPASS